MTVEEFDNQISEIERFYQKPKGTITDEQRKIWYKELKNMNIKRFKYIVSQIYRSSKFMPRLADIIEISAHLGESELKKEEEARKICPICKGAGYITYWKDFDNGDGKKFKYEYMALCKCKKYKQYKGWEVTDEQHRTNYYVPLATELGLIKE